MAHLCVACDYFRVSVVSFQYDSTTLPVGSSLSVHSKGQHDELCTGVKGKEYSDEPCMLLDAADSWLYLIFPESGLCCRACSVADHCGIIAPRWLQQNATYQGTAVIGGVECDGWMKQGGEENYFWTVVASRNRPNERQPCQYYEGYPTFALGSNYWNFTYDAYNINPIPAEVFAVPTDMGCDAMCPQSDLSYQQRLEARFAAGSPTLRRV